MVSKLVLQKSAEVFHGRLIKVDLPTLSKTHLIILAIFYNRTFPLLIGTSASPKETAPNEGTTVILDATDWSVES